MVSSCFKNKIKLMFCIGYTSKLHLADLARLRVFLKSLIPSIPIFFVFGFWNLFFFFFWSSQRCLLCEHMNPLLQIWFSLHINIIKTKRIPWWVILFFYFTLACGEEPNIYLPNIRLLQLLLVLPQSYVSKK